MYSVNSYIWSNFSGGVLFRFALAPCAPVWLFSSDFRRQMSFLRDANHPHVLRLLGRCVESDPYLLILEKCGVVSSPPERDGFAGLLTSPALAP